MDRRPILLYAVPLCGRMPHPTFVSVTGNTTTALLHFPLSVVVVAAFKITEWLGPFVVEVVELDICTTAVDSPSRLMQARLAFLRVGNESSV